MAVTVAQLATAIRLATSSSELSDEETEILTRQQTVALMQIQRYAPAAPEVIQDEAVIRVVGYLFYSSPAAGRQLYANALASSGAAALLDQYRSAEFITLGGDETAASGGTSSGGGGTPADQEAIDAAIAAHNALSTSHRDLDFPDPTLAQIKAPLEAASGNDRLRGSAVRDLATEIDAELGGNQWRDPNQPGQAGQTASQVDARIHAQTGQTADAGPFAVNRIPPLPYVGYFAALPAAVTVGGIIVVGQQHYIGVSFASRTVKYTIASSGDDTGYAAAQGDDPAIGDIDFPNGGWNIQFLWDSDAQALIGRAISGDDPGATLNQVHGSLGAYALRKTVGQGASTRRNSFVDADNKYQYELAVFTNPFTAAGISGEQDFVVTPTNPITYWQPFTPTAAPDAGDITEVIAGTGLSGGGATGTVTINVENPFTDEDEAKLDAIPGQAPANANRLLGFDGDGNYETTGKDWPTTTDIDARIAALRPNSFDNADAAKLDAIPGQSPDNANKYQGFDGDGNYAALDAPSPGGGATPLSSAEPEPVGTAAAGSAGAAARGDHAHPYGGTVPTENLPDVLQRLARDVIAGGDREWPDDDIQIAGTIQDNAYTAVPTSGLTWGKSITHAGGFSIPSPHGIFRFRKTGFPSQPTAPPDNLRLRTGTLESLLQHTVTLTTLTPPAGDNDWWYADGEWDTQPAGDQTAYLEIIEATKLDSEIGDNQITPSALRMPTASRLNGRAITYGEEQFGSQFINEQRTLINGSLTNINVTSIAGNSAFVLNNLTEALNILTEPHGFVLGEWRLRLVRRSSTNFVFHNGETEITVRFSSSIDSIARKPSYDLGQQHYGEIVATTDIINRAGSTDTQIGFAVLRIPWSRPSGLADVLARYAVQTGHALSGNFEIEQELEMVVVGNGTPRGVNAGASYQFASKPTIADDFVDGDRILVEGDGDPDMGEWLKESVETHVAASTGLAGVTLNPRTQLDSVRIGDVEHFYAARTSFASGVGTTAGWLTGTAPARMPAQMNRYDLGRDFVGQDNGFLRMVWTAAQAYTGQIVLTTDEVASPAGGVIPSHVITFDRLNSTTWFRDGLTRGELDALVNTERITFSEPGVSGYSVAHRLRQVLVGGAYQIVDLSQAEYTALAVKDATTIYLVG